MVYDPIEVVLEEPTKDGRKELRVEFTIVLGVVSGGVNIPRVFVQEVLLVLETEEAANGDYIGIDGRNDTGSPLRDSSTPTYMTI